MATMDPLSDVLRSARLSGGIFLDARLTAPWGVTSVLTAAVCAPFVSSPTQIIAYHFVLEGELQVRTADAGPLTLRAGEIVLLPRNDPHVLASDSRVTPVAAHALIEAPTDGGLARIRHGGGGAPAHVVCGFLGSVDGYNPLLATLPKILKIDIREGASRDWVEASLRYAASELTQGKVGASSVMARLSELLFVEAVRQYASTLDESERGWLKAMKDPQIGRALALIHRDIAAVWSADAQLRETGKTIAQLAHAVGYGSEEAFSRAFKREFSGIERPAAIKINDSAWAKASGNLTRTSWRCAKPMRFFTSRFGTRIASSPYRVATRGPIRMNRFSVRSFVATSCIGALLVLTGGIPCVSAAIVTVQPTPANPFSLTAPSIVPVERVLTFDRFDSSLGTLTGVAVRLSSEIDANARITVRNGSSGDSGAVGFEVTFRFTVPGLVTDGLLTPTAGCTITNSVSCDASGPDTGRFDGASGTPGFDVPGASLSSYLGIGTIDARLEIRPSVSSVSGCGIPPVCSVDSSADWSGSMTIDYMFMPSREPAVPAPATPLLLGAALAGLTGLRRMVA